MSMGGLVVKVVLMLVLNPATEAEPVVTILSIYSKLLVIWYVCLVLVVVVVVTPEPDISLTVSVSAPVSETFI